MISLQRDERVNDEGQRVILNKLLEIMRDGRSIGKEKRWRE